MRLGIWKQPLAVASSALALTLATAPLAWGQSPGPALISPGASRPATIAERVAVSRQSTLAWRQSAAAPTAQEPASLHDRAPADANLSPNGMNTAQARAALSALLPPPPKASVRQNSQILGYTLTPRPLAPKRVPGAMRTAGNAQRVASPSF